MECAPTSSHLSFLPPSLPLPLSLPFSLDLPLSPLVQLSPPATISPTERAFLSTIRQSTVDLETALRKFLPPRRERERPVNRVAAGCRWKIRRTRRQDCA